MKFIKNRELAIPLYAKQWNILQREYEINKSVYDVSQGGWKFSKDGESLEPSDLELYNIFLSKLIINENSKEGVINIAFEWPNAFQAAKWINWLISDLNMLLREQERKQAERSIYYLKEQLHNTQLVDIQKSLFQLIESQLKIVMLANATEEYAFKVIDPATIPEIKSKPKRSITVVLGFLVGVIIGSFFLLIKNIFFKKKTILKS